MLASRSSIRILRGYYAFNAGAYQSKEDKQGNTKKRQKEDRAWMRQQRTLWKEEDCCLMSLQSRCQQHHHEQDGEPSGMPGRVPVPMTSSARSVCSALLRNLHGRCSVSHRMPSHDYVPMNTVRRFPSLLLSVHAPFCLIHVVIARI